jgi:low affinity Fe/Cu permease
MENVLVARQSTHSPSHNGRKTKAKPEAAAKTKAQAVAGNDAPAKTASDWFHCFAAETARLSGRPIAFALAVAIVIAWGVTGPLFGYSDTWQLIINTGTTVVTFLMVFLIQHTQNRDSLAFQVKLAELIIAMHGAKNNVAAAEELSDEELEALHKSYSERATETLESLNARRARSGAH